ncbi:DUF7504 family protein [Halorussus litoreus]|uniref:DUF7504 family protein n=1 Tax=Halorussus litoreus TaxID=1710536 RepID=UPI000E27111C|nr:hypothetical protein [Halorussus litoreus]
MGSDRDTVDPPTFRKRLASLKRDGCTVLVTGKVRERVSEHVTRKLMGRTDRSRTRLLALTDYPSADVDNLLPDDASVDDGNVHLLDYDCGTRSATAAASTESSHGTGDCGRQDLDEFRTGICDAITRLKRAENGFEPAQLRVSVFTLSYLVPQHDSETVEQFVSALGDHVRGARGMAHFHLPVADDAEAVRRLAPLFDVRIELRETNGLPEQRWHFPDRDVSTSWVGL